MPAASARRAAQHLLVCEERGRRRFLELQAKGAAVDLAKTVADVEARDCADSNRAHSPLCRADDAVEIDTTERGIDQILAEMLRIVGLRHPAANPAVE